MKIKRLLISFVLGLAPMLAIFCILDGNITVSADIQSPNAPTAELRVCSSGCSYSSVQEAVSAAHSGDVIKVAAGTYTDVTRISLEGTYITQAVCLRMDTVPIITIRGGYTTINWDDSDPVANPTTLDAGGQGRVFFVQEGVVATIEGLQITGGNARKGDANETREIGGGVYAASAAVTLRNNHVSGNVANKGGGVYLGKNSGEFSGNTVTGNTADYGGGLFLDEPTADFSHNTISTNTATFDGGGLLLLQGNDVTFNGNIIIANTATDGGGIYLRYSDATLVNNIIADNVASSTGGGLYINASALSLLHTVIAQNDDDGVCVTSSGNVELINTILVSHTVGISVTEDSVASLDATLWYANGADWNGNVTHIHDRNGDPGFVAPNAGDYHINILSEALDRGIDAGILEDVDGDDRPRGRGYDIGADEYPDLVSVVKQANPTLVRAGERLTYTIRVTNYSTETYTANITDTLPDHLTFTGIITSWTGQLIEPGVEHTWVQSIVVTVETGYNGPLTNTVDVTTDEGEVGAAELVIGCYAVYLPLLLRLG